jgi:hypothetical protein
VSPSANVQVFASFKELGAVAPGLWTGPDAVDLFLTTQWFETLALYGLEDVAGIRLLYLPSMQDQPACCLPLRLSANGRGGIHALSNYYSSLYGVLGLWSDQHQRRRSDWLALGQAIKTLPGAALVNLRPLTTKTPTLIGLKRGLRDAGYWVDEYFCFGNWYLELNGRDFEVYFASLPSRLKNTIARGRGKLSKAGQWNIEICRGADGTVERAMADFEAVYARSWKEQEASPEFVRQLIKMAARQGWLRLGVLRLNDAPVAAQLWLVKGGAASIYKLAYVEGFEKFSAGSVLTAAMMQHAIDTDTVTQVDYLTGDDAYKREWMSHRRERVGLIAFNRASPAGLWAALKHFGGRWVKRLFHRSASQFLFTSRW